MSIQEKINQIIENFSYFDNWENRYEYVIDLGKKIPKIDQSLMIDEFKVQGCTSNLWVIPEVDGNIISFNGASDSVIVQGLFAILSSVYSGETAKEIINNPPNFLEKIELKEHLGPSRANGLNSLIKHINSVAKNSII
jgi:cysteine desulfuration protein SufE|tara:strand:+ start:687 stop:1100 length:414 start_codon:yes stop_codon:yes gene_type:complete